MKKTLIFLIVIIIVIAGTWIYLKQRKSKDLEPLIKERLSNLVNDASHGLYKLDIENLEIDILKSKLVLVKAHLVPDTIFYKALEKQQMAPNDIFEVYIDKLSLDQIDVAALTSNKDINLNKLFIDSPVVKVWHKKQPYNRLSDSTKTLYQQISKDVGKIKVDTLLVRNANFTHYNRRLNDKSFHFENVNFIFTDLLLDSTTQFDQSRFLYAKDCRISIKDFAINTSDSLYRLTAGELQIRTRDKVMEAKKLTMRPRLNRKSFYNNINHQQDIFTIEIEKLDFDKVEWWSLLGEESFLSKKMVIQNGNIKVYNDKSMPVDTRSKLGKFPHQLLAKVNFTIQVDTIKIKGLNMSYEEFNPKSQQSGILHFDGIDGTISNVTNDSARIIADKECRINVSAMFMSKTPLRARFSFNLSSVKRGDFSMQASLGSIDQDKLNEILVPLALVKINKVNIKSLDVTMHGDNYAGTGKVKMIYNDLNVSALKNNGDTLKKRALFSFIANNFILKKQNPSPGAAARIETGTHEHEANRSFFNLVWKTIFVGAGKTVGFNKAK